MADSLTAAWAARKDERGAYRGCNPETEFAAGWEARDPQVAELQSGLPLVLVDDAAMDWASYFAGIGSHVGDPEFTQALVVKLLRGPRPFGCAAAT